MTTINDLKTGDMFHHLGENWIVRGDAFRNGSTDKVRACMCTSNQEMRPFNINIEVQRTGTSMFAPKYQANPINKL